MDDVIVLYVLGALFLFIAAVTLSVLGPILAWRAHGQLRSLRLAAAHACPLSAPVPGLIALAGRLRRNGAELSLEDGSGARVILEPSCVPAPEGAEVTVIGDCEAAGQELQGYRDARPRFRVRVDGLDHRILPGLDALNRRIRAERITRGIGVILAGIGLAPLLAIAGFVYLG